MERRAASAPRQNKSNFFKISDTSAAVIPEYLDEDSCDPDLDRIETVPSRMHHNYIL
jgi:hypothetical protein